MTENQESREVQPSTFESEAVLEAEIHWMLKMAQSHFSFNSCLDLGMLFAQKFPDSNIAKKFACSATKAHT